MTPNLLLVKFLALFFAFFQVPGQTPVGIFSGGIVAGSVVSFVNSNGCDFGNNATTCTFTLALTTGNRIIGAIDTGITTNTTSFGDTCDTYAHISGAPFIPSGANSILLDGWTAPVTCTGTKTFTCTVSTGVGGGSGSNCGVIQVSGASSFLDKVSPFVQGGSGDNGLQSIPSSPATGTTAITSNSNELLVGLFGGATSGTCNNTMTITAGSGAMRQDTTIGFGRYYAITTQTVSASGAYSGSINVTAPTGSACMKSAGVLVTVAAP